MGAPVVHGVHLLLWALDHWISQPMRLVSISAAFRKPVYLAREVELDTVEETPGRAKLVVRTVEGSALEATIEYALGSTSPFTLATTSWPERVSPNAPSQEEVATARGQIVLALDESLARARFPRAMSFLGAGQVAELLAVTRLVGMMCPGRHSLLGGIELRESAAGQREMSYEVSTFTPKYSRVAIAIRGPSLAGSVEAFHRPPPPSLAMTAVIEAVPRDVTRGQRALVIGGSRGIGEAFAKAIAAGGGDVCLTYRHGIDEATRVVGEIRAAGLSASAIQYDVTAPTDLRASWPLSGAPTHLYYLATPTLFSIRKGVAFDQAELDLLLRYFVFGLSDAVSSCFAAGAERLVVWSPSTTMLDRAQGGAAYCIAKAAMEELCRHLPQMLPVTVHAPRLGRIDTDQTTGLIALPASPALPVVIEQLQRLAG